MFAGRTNRMLSGLENMTCEVYYRQETLSWRLITLREAWWLFSDISRDSMKIFSQDSRIRTNRKRKKHLFIATYCVSVSVSRTHIWTHMRKVRTVSWNVQQYDRITLGVRKWALRAETGWMLDKDIVEGTWMGWIEDEWFLRSSLHYKCMDNLSHIILQDHWD